MQPDQIYLQEFYVGIIPETMPVFVKFNISELVAEQPCPIGIL